MRAGWLVLASAVHVLGHAADAADPMEKKEAQAWLRHVHAAAQTLNYAGSFFYQQGNRVRNFKVAHVIEGRNELEKRESLDGKRFECVRTNEESVCYKFDSHVAVVEKRITPDLFPALLADNSIDIAEHYDVRRGANDRVAGVDCQTVTLEPKDGLRYGYRLFTDRSTGLLLRAQTLNEKNETIDQISFSQVTVGNIDKAQTRSVHTSETDWRNESNDLVTINLSAWVVKAVPAGFKRIREVHRTLPAESGGTTRRDVSQVVYSDGLAAISIFIEPATAASNEGWKQQGVTNLMSKRQGDYWVTIVGDVPASAIRQIANSLEYRGK